MASGLAIVAAALAAGCAFDWGFPADSSDEGGQDDAALVDRVVEAARPADGGGDETSPAFPCKTSADCSGQTKQYCHFSDYLCGDGGTIGTCTNIPSGCSADDEVCSCDGKTYANECTAIAETDLDLSKKGCPIDAGTQFRCGTHICEQDKEYCIEGSSPPTFDCKSLGVTTNSCSPLSCACPAIMAMKCTCNEMVDGEVVLSGCQ